MALPHATRFGGGATRDSHIQRAAPGCHPNSPMRHPRPFLRCLPLHGQCPVLHCTPPSRRAGWCRLFSSPTESPPHKRKVVPRSVCFRDAVGRDWHRATVIGASSRKAFVRAFQSKTTTNCHAHAPVRTLQSSKSRGKRAPARRRCGVRGVHRVAAARSERAE